MLTKTSTHHGVLQSSILVSLLCNFTIFSLVCKGNIVFKNVYYNRDVYYKVNRGLPIEVRSLLKWCLFRGWKWNTDSFPFRNILLNCCRNSIEFWSRFFQIWNDFRRFFYFVADWFIQFERFFPVLDLYNPVCGWRLLSYYVKRQ